MSEERVLEECSDEMLRESFKRAVDTYRIQEALSETKPSEESIAFIKSVLSNVQSRVHALTPSRRDMHVEFDAHFDIDLFVQMYRHNAIQKDDAIVFVDCLFTRLKLLCAPCQDEAIQEVQTMLTKADSSSTMQEVCAHCIVIGIQILDDIEALIERLHETCE